MLRLRRPAIQVVLVALACSALSAAAFGQAEVCLTGNVQGQNPVLKNGAYRVVWAGTDEPKPLGDPSRREWVPFSIGALTNGKPDTMPMNTAQIQDIKLKYWVGPGDFEIEIDLGQVCDVRHFQLDGWQDGYELKAFYPEAKRWLPVARSVRGPQTKRDSRGRVGFARNRVEVKGLRTRYLRVTAGPIESCTARTFSEFMIWGAPLAKDAEETRPAPLPPDDKPVPYRPLDLKPVPPGAVLPEPFVFPQPAEMSFDIEERLTLPRNLTIVLPAKADDPAFMKIIAEDLAQQLSTLVPVTVSVSDKAHGPAIRLGLCSDGGVCADLAARRKIAPDAVKPEGYALEVTKDGVALVGVDLEGLIWATKSLLFLLRVEADASVTLPLGHIRDFPRAEFRVVFGYPNWSGTFKRKLLKTMLTTKANMILLRCDDENAEVAYRHRMKRALGLSLFPQSPCGTGGDLLEKHPGMSRKDVGDPSRYSADCAHPDFWPGVIRALDLRLEQYRKQGCPHPYVNLGLDEMFDNPWMVTARNRTRGLTEREALTDAIRKGIRIVRNRGCKPMLLSTSYCVGVRDNRGRHGTSPFDCFFDIENPSEMPLWSYTGRPDDERTRNRIVKNRKLRERGHFIFSQGARTVTPESEYNAAMFANWGNEGRAVFLGRFMPLMHMINEENWSQFDRKKAYQSPEYLARQQRVMDFYKLILDDLPIPVPGRTYEYFTVNMQPKANRTLRDDVFGDGKGWLDEGPTRDMRHVPTGRQEWRGVPYDMCGKAAVVAGPACTDGDFPDRITDIPVGRKASVLYFAHVCKRSHWRNHGKDVSTVGFYRVRYDDGSFVSVPVNLFDAVGPWNQPFGYSQMETEPLTSPVAGADVIWRGSTDGGQDVTVYSMPWRNPYPDRTIEAVDMLASAFNETNDNRLCLLALSGRVTEEADVRFAEHRRGKPTLRRYHARPAVPEGASLIDLTRRSIPPPALASAKERDNTWATADGWFTAVASEVYLEKYDMTQGVYSALHPDDEPWRYDTTRTEPHRSGWLEIRFKQPLTLRAVGFKGAMQLINVAQSFPMDCDVYIMRTDRYQWQKVGSVQQHIGEEGEDRWVLPQAAKATAVKFDIRRGNGISAVYLYGKPLGKPRRNSLKPVEAADMFKKKKAADEDLLDLLEGN